ncbi:arylsulfatase [Leptospira terpstrae serovar Hualin str. LT 11-33 = ATCC 700639]|uniref:Arylsulfatase n=2 Tax=Leptospira TaxID=171 RepID=N1VYW8_9LEPT|nr:arylsulfatase [Leptospira terpstrae serovar Hualin str. LT 11-33 = ATCC 700639]
MKLNKLVNFKNEYLEGKFSLTIWYLFLYCFYWPISFSFGVWFYFHGIFVSIFTIFVIVLEFYINQKSNNRNRLNTMCRLVLWSFFVLIFTYQEIYQTSVTLDLVIYSFQNLSLLYGDFFTFLYHWDFLQWLALATGIYLVFDKNRKRIFFTLLIISILFLYLRFTSQWMINDNYTKVTTSFQIKKGKTVLESIPGKPNIVFVLLEGVSRKQLSSLQSRYIDFSLLEGSHFWIPMPHTSKSLLTWMTGEAQLKNSRLQLDDSVFELNLPVLLQKKHNYQTVMIYTQSIYLEGMEQFFPKIFQTIVDKSILEKRYGSLYPSFSWGMDDRVILPAMNQINITEKNPLFLLIGLSQTHSPYFVVNENTHSQWNSPLVRYHASINEEVAVLDSIISYWKENSSRETLLILSADHGESFGEEGAFAHNYSLYNQETDVPFLFYFLKSGQVYIPKLGTSVDFKETILRLLETNTNLLSEKSKVNFFNHNYQPSLVLKTWNSEVQKAWINHDKKYIYHSDRDQLLQMDFIEDNRTPISDLRLKQKVLNQIYSEIR